ncbi:MAG TPA: hypothetical protein VG713_08895, partial [Pirellulales bacterium]|nr:hypothetical protein [Pirellulales bacterium]
SVLATALGRLPEAYKRFHRDQLYHRHDRTLFTAFFICRACEAVLQIGPPWDEPDSIVERAIVVLNDYLGYRPVAVLHSRQRMEPYQHEWISPVPLFWPRVGVDDGPHRELIERAIEVLRETDPAILESAYFDLGNLDELAVDPRAYDFDHPANKRPNYHFGQWDPRSIDLQGNYRRFVLQSVSIDCIAQRVVESGPGSQSERLVEAATVLAGTILMASATSGSGPDTYDSSVTLATLLPRIAAMRDRFYRYWLERLVLGHAERLRAEAERLRQPFAGARQDLNRRLAQLRASQLERVHLARLFAKLGHADASQRQLTIVPVASARIVAEIDSHLAIDSTGLPARCRTAAEIESLIQRGIQCGALIDPWNILGFQARFSLFPAIENSVHDHRVDLFIELLGRVFDYLIRTAAQAAAAGQGPWQREALDLLDRLGRWWDRFGTADVSGIEHLSGGDAIDAATEVAAVLEAWREASTTAGDISFWRSKVDRLQSPKSYSIVLERLLELDDLVAARALLAHWVGEADRVALADAGDSFHRLATDWLARALAKRAPSWSSSANVRRFFDPLEASAERWWDVPRFELGDDLAVRRGSDPTEDDDPDEQDDDLYGAAYEGVVYRDTTADGVEGSMLEGSGPAATEIEWDAEAARISARIGFLTTIARLWRLAADAHDPGASADDREAFAGWSSRAQQNNKDAIALLEAIARYRLPAAGGSHELMLEYDRRRLAKESLMLQIMLVAVEMSAAARWLRAAAGAGGEENPIEQRASEILHAALAGDRSGACERFGPLRAELEKRTILYTPLSRGGDPRHIVGALGMQRLLLDLAQVLPRAGLLLETYRLIEIAQAMERIRPPGDRTSSAAAVSEFDRVFDAALAGMVEWVVRTASSSPEGDDELIDALQRLAAAPLKLWLAHSRGLRLSALERFEDNDRWQATVGFIERWGGEVFTQRFLNLGNLRAILHGGVAKYLNDLQATGDSDWSLLEALDREIPRADAIETLTGILEAIVENYSQYRDFNATTTQSDRGDRLYVLLDYLRLKASYDRFAWTIRPLLVVHKELIRNDRALAAEAWAQAIVARSTEPSDWYLRQLDELVQRHGVRLASVADRIKDRLVAPIATERLRALLRRSIEERRRGARPEAFEELEREANELAETPQGAGFEVPHWIAALEEEAERVQHADPQSASEAEKRPLAIFTWADLLAQIREIES